jgi:hypothetical protein
MENGVQQKGVRMNMEAEEGKSFVKRDEPALVGDIANPGKTRDKWFKELEDKYQTQPELLEWLAPDPEGSRTFRRMNFIVTLAEYAIEIKTPIGPDSVAPRIWLDNEMLKYILPKISPFDKYQIIIFNRASTISDVIGDIQTNGAIFLLFTGGNHYDVFAESRTLPSDKPIIQAALDSSNTPQHSARARFAVIAAALGVPTKGGRTRRKHKHRRRKRTVKRRS